VCLAAQRRMKVDVLLRGRIPSTNNP
jgi:hypothetical protein